MKSRINMHKMWRPSERQQFFDGIYRVPEDLSEVVADQAVREGFANRIEEVAPPAPKSARRPEFDGRVVIVAASGPSLTPEVAAACAGFPVIAVNDAYRLFPAALALYACDTTWWEHHKGAPDFAGERWSTQGTPEHNDKSGVRERFKLHLIGGRTGAGFSADPEFVHYGSNSGFQAVNLALLWGARRIVLVGFNMQAVAKKTHFFGDHPGALNMPTNYPALVGEFKNAAKTVPAGVEIINATPNSALKGYKKMELADALAG